MGLNDTPQANRAAIGFFGKRNAGKSCLVNAVTGQEVSIVSPVRGTTTDHVYKAMELLPLGPVLIIDTPGFDDEGGLGEQRVRKTRQVLNKTDAAVLVVDAAEGWLSDTDWVLIHLFEELHVPYLIAYNKCDLLECVPEAGPPAVPQNTNEQDGANDIRALFVSGKTGHNITLLKEEIALLTRTEEPALRILGDLIHPGDFVVLVTPIDKAAPKGRLILPQQQTIRDILEGDAAAIVVKEFELKETLTYLMRRPALVVTDSQVFAKAAADVPENIPLTSFSILFARYKGFLEESLRGIMALDKLRPNSKVLICEGCTHHRQCDDIGTVKIPRWIRENLGFSPEFSFTQGGTFPDDLSPYSLVIHCGGCMLNDREMRWRQQTAAAQKVPFTNYGILIAHMQGILKRAIRVFPGILDEKPVPPPPTPEELLNEIIEDSEQDNQRIRRPHHHAD